MFVGISGFVIALIFMVCYALASAAWGGGSERAAAPAALLPAPHAPVRPRRPCCCPLPPPPLLARRTSPSLTCIPASSPAPPLPRPQGIKFVRGKVGAAFDGLWWIFWLIAAAVATSILTVDNYSINQTRASCAFCWISWCAERESCTAVAGWAGRQVRWLCTGVRAADECSARCARLLLDLCPLRLRARPMTCLPQGAVDAVAHHLHPGGAGLRV